MLKALVIQNSNGKIRDYGDLLKVAKAEAQEIFHTEENVQVLEVFPSHILNGYVVVVRCDISGRTNNLA